MTPDTVQKLEEAFSWGCSDIEACLYADICRQTLYTYQKNNPGFLDRKQALKKHPTMKARRNISRSIEGGDEKVSQWYLENKEASEFSRLEKREVKGDPITKIDVHFIDGESEDKGDKSSQENASG